MSFIKFPSHIKPARVTVALMRVDETVSSPLTNVQQIYPRGNPAWRWTFEYTDLSDDEREVVQGFLLNCKGSTNVFNVTDPGDYAPRGGVSDWVDTYHGYGTFTPGESYWLIQGGAASGYITNERRLLAAANVRTVQGWLRFQGDSGTGQVVADAIQGRTYLFRTKFFKPSYPSPTAISLQVNTNLSPPYGLEGVGPGSKVTSTGMVSLPFLRISSGNILTMTPEVKVWIGSTEVFNDGFSLADVRMPRCALLANSENLFYNSNNFAVTSHWTAFNVAVQSGQWNSPVTRIQSDGWRFGSNSTAVNTLHYIEQAITKTNTRDMYTLAFHCYHPTPGFAEYWNPMITITDSISTVDVIFDWPTDTIQLKQISGSGFTRIWAERYYLGFDTYRYQLTTYASSHTILKGRITIANSNWDAAWTGVDSLTNGIHIGFASLVKFPYMKPYVGTTSGTVDVTSGQTGNEIILAGFDARDIVNAGQRFEIVNRYYNQTSGTYERSEFKRVTEDCVATADGNMRLLFDPSIRNAPVTDRNFAEGANEGMTMHNAVIFGDPEMKGRLVGGTIQYIDKPLKAMDVVFDVMEDLTE